MDKTIFKAYDIRGVFPEQINPEIAEKIAQTLIYILSQKLNKPISELKLAVGRDIRQSSEPLIKKLIETILKYGVKIDDLGLISVNDLYFAVGHYQYDGGIMGTASHNPPEYGGFKMVMADPDLKNSILFISGEELYQVMQEIDLPLKAEELAGTLQTKDIFNDHLKHILNFIDLTKIKPLKIVVDAGNGMNGKMAMTILEKMGCQPIPLFIEPDADFPNRPPNPLTQCAEEKIATKITQEGADFGVMFDVDGDRMFLVDEVGNFIPGDMVLLVLARAFLKLHPGSGIAYNLICSHAVPELIQQWGGKAIRSEVGYRNLARHMKEEGGLMSGEVSAHFAFKDNFYADNGFIALALATQAISEDGRLLSEIIKDFKLYYRADEVNLKIDDKDIASDLIRQHYKDNIRDEIDGITIEFDDWWFNVRPSNTEPILRLTVEARDKEMAKEKIDEILKIIN
ncbi:MAG: phosphomannomutase/phosphoglucomutase [Patescibacteria group bacterium]|nr:phosphomannomutase/phosphoglucomutase [Patescibacteria group bacterium]